MVRKLIKALLAGTVLIPTLVFGLGLGDIRLHSGLNQQFNAEIDLLSVEPGDVGKISVTLASYETFAKIGIDRPSVLMLLNFEIAKRSNGTPYISIKSRSAIEEPFLDFLVEVNWPSGQVLKEYTVLLDPPELTSTQAPVVAAPVTEESPLVAPAPQPEAVMPAAPSEAAAEEPTPSAAEAGTAPEEVAGGASPETAPEMAPPSETVAAAEKPVTPEQPTTPQQPAARPGKPVRAVPASEARAAFEAKGKRVQPAVTPVATGEMNYGPVRRNETLYRIAEDLRPNSQVSIDQMMIALYNNNRESFIKGNINLLRKGAVLRIDDPAELTALSKAEASREVARHNRAWQEYRATVAETTPKAVETEKPAAKKPTVSTGSAAVTKEEPKLTLVTPSKPGAGKTATAGGTSEQGEAESLRKELLLATEATEARRKENEELNKRLKELEGQLDSMQKLLTLKDDNLAAMQQKLAEAQKSPEAAKSAAATAATAPATVKAPETAKPAAEMPKAPETVPAGETAKPAETTATTDAAKPAAPATPEATPAPATPETAPSAAATPEVTAPVEPAAPAKPAPAKPKRKPFVPPPPPPETSFIDDMLANPTLLVAGAVGVIVLGLGVMLVMRRRRQGRGFQESILTVGTTSSMMKGKGENPASETSFLSDLAISGMGGKVQEDTEVDPLTEADVYMAYNRFQQAEELLKEGIKHSPERDELHAKLLEVYYKAKNRKEFELLAEARSTSMQKNDAMWQKVIAMGHELAPDNPLFQGASAGGVALSASAQESAPSADVFDIGLDLDALSSEMEEAGGGSEFNVDLGLDFSDLGMEGSAQPAAAAPEPEPAASLDFDLGALSEAPAVEEPVAEAAPEFDLSAFGGGLEVEEPVASEPVKQEETLLGDLDFDLGSMTEEAAPVVEEEATTLDMGDFDLGSFAAEPVAEEEHAASIDFGDLDFGGMDLGAGAEETPGFDLGDLGEESLEGLDEIGTKLDLAKAYVDMGDSEGARSMLEEVIHEGSSEQKRQAQELLEQIA